MALSKEGGVKVIEWTPANVVTVIRVCLIPVFVLLTVVPWFQGASQNVQPFVSMVMFAVISLTDSLDGYLARSRNEVTVFGKFMDPIADKLLVVSALICLVELSLLPGWVPILIVSREFLVSGLRMLVASGGTVVAASWIGKAKTLTTMVAICMFLIVDAPMVAGLGFAYRAAAWAMMAVALLLTVWSMVDYFMKAWPLLAQVKHEEVAQDVCGSNLSLECEAAAQSVVQAALERGVRIGTAESCTGGLIAASLTSVPGSSAVVAGGVVSYMTRIKETCLGVDAQTVAREGVVSAAVAQEMAQGARLTLGVDYAVSVTGIAGPSGGDERTPVGTVCIAVSGPDSLESVTAHFDGGRSEVREQAVLTSLQMLDRAIRG